MSLMEIMGPKDIKACSSVTNLPRIKAPFFRIQIQMDIKAICLINSTKTNNKSKWWMLSLLQIRWSKRPNSLPLKTCNNSQITLISSSSSTKSNRICNCHWRTGKSISNQLQTFASSISIIPIKFMASFNTSGTISKNATFEVLQ